MNFSAIIDNLGIAVAQTYTSTPSPQTTAQAPLYAVSFPNFRVPGQAPHV